MGDEWFRSSDWSADAQDDFEHRLRRARAYSRPQYLRIKGLALISVGEVKGARTLWERTLADPEASWVEQASTTEHLADSYRSDAPEKAVTLYRRVSELSPSLSGTSGTHHVKLAELLLDEGTTSDLPEVGELLEWWAANGTNPFPSAQFQWNIAYIKYAQAIGDKESVREGAHRALDLADRGPVFPRHPTVGLVHAEGSTLAWLRSLT